MIQRDYLMRQINQFMETLLYILGLIKLENYKGALESIDYAFQELLGLGYGAAKVMSKDSLVKLFSDDNRAQIGQAKCLMAVRLFHEAGKVHAARKHFETSYVAHLKALELLLAVQRQGVDDVQDGDSQHHGQDLSWPDYAPSLDDVVHDLDDYLLPVEIGLQLFHYYGQAGAYAEAEDLLFDLLEREPDQIAVTVATGITFYEKLRTQPTECLQAGGLPPEEVEASLAELRAYQV